MAMRHDQEDAAKHPHGQHGPLGQRVSLLDEAHGIVELGHRRRRLLFFSCFFWISTRCWCLPTPLIITAFSNKRSTT